MHETKRDVKNESQPTARRKDPFLKEKNYRKVFLPIFVKVVNEK